jgi:hypothetical protein
VFANRPPHDRARLSAIGRIGAHVAHSRNDPKAMTAAARSRFLARFLEEADPSGVLPEEERFRRAEHLRKVHFLRLALRSAETRARRASSLRRRSLSTSDGEPSATTPAGPSEEGGTDGI